MYNCEYLWCSDIGNDSGMSSILSEFGWYLVILPCNRVVAGPQVSSAWFISSIVTL